MFKNKIVKYGLLSLISVAVLVACFIGGRRMIHENTMKQVELVVSYREIKQFSRLSGVDSDTLLLKLREEAHITSVALEEDTLEDLVEEGRVTLLKGSEISNMYRVGNVNRYILQNLYKKTELKSDHFYLIIERDADFKRIKNYMEAEFGRGRISTVGRLNILEILDDKDDLLQIGLGISKDISDALSGFGFSVIPRFKNSYRTNWNVARLKLSSLDKLKMVNTIIFEENSVLGFPRELGYVQEKLVTGRYQVGAIEFTNQAGMNQLALAMSDLVVRVHSIGEQEMKLISVKKARARYVRAAKERGVKILFLHPFFSRNEGENLLDENFKYFNAIYTELVSHNFEVTPLVSPGIINYKPIKSWESVMIAMGVVAGLFILINYFIPLSLLWLGLLSLGFLLLHYLSVLFDGTHIWHQSLAFISAVTFPSLAIISQYSDRYDFTSDRKLRLGSLIYVVKIVGISLIGAAFIVGLLSDTSYLVGVDRFLGVKLSFILPLFLIGIYFFLHPHRISSFLFVFRRLLYSPVRTLQLVAVVFTLFFMFLYVFRSGNFTSFHLPLIEEKLRVFLENVLYVRPRTKEFLIGYPFLFISFYYLNTWVSRHWVWFFNGIGSVALVSLVNSFCHIHTPLIISLYRTGLGLGLGLIVGGLYIVIFKLIQKILRRVFV